MNDAVQIDDLAEEFARLLRAGQRPAVEEYAARHPERADEVRAALAAVELMERLKPRRGAPDRLGDYRIIREIGRGGMGIVYEADHEALGRHVAVKVLPGLADDKARERFRREARAAARLHHTNIVPVFGVGERDGLCYYVMQLIHGRGLDRVAPPAPTVDLTTPLDADQAESLAPGTPLGDARAIARIGVQVADALAHAHAQGVLHRDIKPSNLLLDDSGTVWVTDFGVAKLIEGADLTGTGDMVGTLRYMPPERFSGVSDRRGDVYSLGVTLIELLAGRPAFPVTTPQHLIHLITTKAIPRLRDRDPSIPADLETVLLKAAARDPAHRYQSAAELADDLRRFLADRPVLARRAGPLSQGYRWCRRNPAVAASLAAVVLSLAAAAGVSLAANVRTARALEAETQQRGQAEQTAALALAALNRTFDRFAPARLVATAPATNEDGIELPPRPPAPPESVPLLEDLLRTYEQIAESARSFPSLRSQAAEASHRIGDLRQRLGRLDEAATAYRAAIDLHDEPVMRARAMNELGRVLRATNRDDDARRMHDRAARELLDAPDGVASRPEGRFELARAYHMADRRDMMRPPGPGRPPWVRPTRRAAEILEPLVSDFPTVPEYRHLLACCYRDEPPRPGGGDRGLKLLRDLVYDFPGVPDYRIDLCEALAGWPPGPGRFGGAGGLNEAIAMSADLVRQYPAVPEYAAAHARYLDRLGLQLLRTGRPDEAEGPLARAYESQARLVKRYPGVAAYEFWMCLIERSLAECLLSSGRYREATIKLCAAILRAERLDGEQGLPGVGMFLGTAHLNLGQALWAGGQIGPAVEVWGLAGQREPRRGPPWR